MAPPSPSKRLLILGGTTEARELAARLADVAGIDTTLSLAGRTRQPAAQPVPVRTGGFGGAQGLASYLQANRTDLLVDATHPFALRISANAEAASALVRRPLVVLRRPDWRRQAGDRWIERASIAAAVDALGLPPRRILAALGRQDVGALESAPQHFWLIRSVDPVVPRPKLPEAEYRLERGPFEEDSEIELLQRFGIDAVLCKNSGGAASYAKITAARRLGLPVHMVARPPPGPTSAVRSVAEALDAILHRLVPAAERGE